MTYGTPWLMVPRSPLHSISNKPRQQRRLNQILTIPSRSKPVHYPRQIAKDIHSYRTKTTAPSNICATSARSRNSPVHLDSTRTKTDATGRRTPSAILLNVKAAYRRDLDSQRI
ncbi:uncharacterized protein LOC112467961 [Temnothorax curvispinosus]|uniref:Uncharacterized protein LOC112467961 n=1 Tax=Temnothorax curvispinosus TaxID=300111 RepID=A0A6J1RD42_9HYME|nr:uncharacterized protein LOC112467961 [Temnothorax curvispinosus]